MTTSRHRDAHHLVIDVDDFEGFYREAKGRGLLDGDTFGAVGPLSTQRGWVQMYIRDPAGNLVELDWPDVSTLDRTVVTTISASSRTSGRRWASPRRRTLYHGDDQTSK